MSGQNKPALVALRSRREVVIDALSTHFASDALDMDEFEQRLDLAHRATSVAELDALLSDLQPAADEASGQSLIQPTAARHAPVRTRVRKRVLSVLGSVQRKGTWRVPERLRVFSVMGAVELDFREAQLGPGITEVSVTTVMGAVSIVVPPQLRVECHGVGLLGHFESMETGAGEMDLDAPLLRIVGVAVMGALEISEG